MATTASRELLLPPVKASQMPETEGMNNLLVNVGARFWRKWPLGVENSEFMCVWTESGAFEVSNERWKEYGGGLMVGFKKCWVKAIDVNWKRCKICSSTVDASEGFLGVGFLIFGRFVRGITRQRYPSCLLMVVCFVLC